MDRKFFKVTALLLAAILLALPLTACSGGTDSDDNGNQATDGNTGGNGNGSNASSSYGEFVYVPTYQKLSAEEDVSSMDRLIYANGKIYMVAWLVTGTQVDYYDEEWNLITDEEKIANGEYAEKSEYDKTEPALCSMNIDGTDFKRLENFTQTPVPEGSQGNSYINNMCVDSEGNIWIAEEIYAYHYDEEGTYYNDGTQYTLRKLDATGTEIASVDLSEIIGDQEYFYINSFIVDNDGVLYLTGGGSEEGVYVVDTDGTLLGIIAPEEENVWISSLVMLKDGTVAAMASSENGYVLKTVDKTAKAFGDDVPVPYNVYNLINGGGEYDYYYNDSYSLYGYTAETETATQLVNWIDSDINTNDLQNIIPLEDGRILGNQQQLAKRHNRV